MLPVFFMTAIQTENYAMLKQTCEAAGATLVAVSKTKPIEDILALYELGQRDFGENYVQELISKQVQLPSDIRWHFIGHLQRNKVKYIAPFVHLIHGVDSWKLLEEIQKQGDRINRVISVLLQVHIAQEETKFGLDAEELQAILQHPALTAFSHIRIRGLMGMASFSSDPNQVRKEFAGLKSLFDQHQAIQSTHAAMEVLSMGMSSDFRVALEEGSNMIRVGSLLFGQRD